MADQTQLEEKVNLGGGVAEAKPLVIAGIPAFNEERMIAKVVLEARKFVDWVIVCDDGSTDSTGEIAEGLGADVIRHGRNLGYGAALRSLFLKAQELGADVMVTLDGDGQHNPHEIPFLIRPVLDNRADVVIGSRFLGDFAKNEVPRLRKIGIGVITKLTNAASRYRVSDAQSGFRVYGHKALRLLNTRENGMGVSVEALMEAKKNGLNVLEVPTHCNYYGLDKTSTHGSLSHGASVIMSIVRLVVEDKPLISLGMPGVMSLIAGAGFGFWMLQLYTVQRRIVTNVALAALAFTVAGFFCLSTAIMLYAISRLAEKIEKNRARQQID